MQIRTMAVQINEKTWPIAVACLGSRIASQPFPEVEGGFLVINTPDQMSGRYVGSRVGRTQYGSRTYGDTVSLGNIWLSEDDFRVMYKFDGRKNTETFFDVLKVADQPLPPESDDFGARLKALNEAYYGVDEKEDRD